MRLYQVKNGMKVHIIRRSIRNSELYKNWLAVYGVMYKHQFIPSAYEYADEYTCLLITHVLCENEIDVSEVKSGYVSDKKFIELDHNIIKPI